MSNLFLYQWRIYKPIFFIVYLVSLCIYYMILHSTKYFSRYNNTVEYCVQVWQIPCHGSYVYIPWRWLTKVTFCQRSTAHAINTNTLLVQFLLSTLGSRPSINFFIFPIIVIVSIIVRLVHGHDLQKAVQPAWLRISLLDDQIITNVNICHRVALCIRE